jgi:hypothetical protein
MMLGLAVLEDPESLLGAAFFLDFFLDPELFSSASPELSSPTGAGGGAGISGAVGKGAGPDGGGVATGGCGATPGAAAGRGGAMGAGGAAPSAGIGAGIAGLGAPAIVGGAMGEGTFSFGAPGAGMTGAPGTLSLRLGAGWGEGGAAMWRGVRIQVYSLK